MSKLLSIVICTYNGQKYLREVIDAILTQDGFNEIVDQLIIVDNASTDSTKEIILEYERKYSNVKYIFESQPGLSYARKHGAFVKTNWVVYLDDDNIIMNDWLKQAQKYINQNPNIGVFNGCSIAHLRYKASDYELDMLEAIYPYLACTHLNMNDYKNNVEPALKAPFGAGMVLRTIPLKEYLSSGWTSNEGRKGNSLGSGEDGEIAEAILNKGYAYGFNNNMALQHIIPFNRLEKDYVRKLLKGLDIGFYMYISNKNNYIYYRLRTMLKSIIIITLFPIQILLTNKKSDKLKLKNQVVSRLRLVSYIIKDFLIKK